MLPAAKMRRDSVWKTSADADPNPAQSPARFIPFVSTVRVAPIDLIQMTELPYCTAEVFIDVFIDSVLSAALSCVTVPDTSSLPMDSAGVQ